MSLNDEDRTRFHHCFSHIQSQIVVEVTEEENMSEEALFVKEKPKVFQECLRWMIMVVVIIQKLIY